MLSKELINDIAKYIENRVDSAQMIIDDVPVPIDIIKTEVDGNLIKVFTNTTKGKGQISDILIKDSSGVVIMSKPRAVLKSSTHSLISSFYIKIVERESSMPINIFEKEREVSNG